MPELESTARELADETGQRIIPLAMDVTKRDQVDRGIAEAAERLGGLHILINSAALPGGSSTASGPVETVNDDDLLWDFDVKYVGALRCARAAIPFLKEQGWGRIVNISGHNGRNAGNLSAGARNVSLVHLTKTLSIQLGPHGITVNCVYPGSSAPSAPQGYWQSGPPKPASPRKRSSSRTLLRDLLGATPLAAWWNLTR